MIQIIAGKKGSGKTKRLIAQTNEAVNTKHGSILFIDDGKDYLYDVRHQVRFVDASEYGVCGPDMFYGFICGIAAQDFDLDTVFVDAFLRIVGKPMDELEDFFRNLVKVLDAHKINMVLSVSADPATLPDYAKAWLQEA